MSTISLDPPETTSEPTVDPDPTETTADPQAVETTAPSAVPPPETTKQASSDPDTLGAEIFAATFPAAVLVALFWIVFFFRMYIRRKKQKGDVESPSKLQKHKSKRPPMVQSVSDKDLSMEERSYHYQLRREITNPTSSDSDPNLRLSLPPNAMTKPQVLQVDPPPQAHYDTR